MRDHRIQPEGRLWAKLKTEAREMRREPTEAEDLLWQQLRNRKVKGAKFRRQHAIDRFIVDFYCREANLVIEVDGPIHQQQIEEDMERQEHLGLVGFRVLRFTNEQVITDVKKVVEEITRYLG